MKKVLTWTLCILMLLALLAACAGEHEHTFDSKWNTDENEHWHEATCEHTDQVSDKGAHTYEEGQDVCTVCGRERDHTHTYADAWTSDANNHWHATTCGHSDKKDEAAHEKNAQGACAVCGYQICQHTYADVLTDAGDGENHWYAPTCGCEVDGIEKAPHVDESLDGVCEACNTQTCKHTYDPAVWANDADYHWNVPTCACVNAKPNMGLHVDANGDDACDVCAAVLHIHKFDTENWSKDENGHWHAATCGHDIKAEEAAHTGYEETGVCDVCGYVVFKLFGINFNVTGEGISVLDQDGNPLKNAIYKENSEVVFKVVVAKDWRLLPITGAEEVGESSFDQTTGIETFTYKVVLKEDGQEVNVTAIKTSNVEIIASGEGSYEYTKAWSAGTWNVTWTPEKDGTYYAFMLGKQDGSSVDINVYKKGETYQYGVFCYEFEGKAGEPVEIEGYYFAMSKGVLEYDWYVVQVDNKFTLPTLEGDGFTMPAKVPVTVTFTLPEPGAYLLYSSIRLNWIKEGETDGTIEQQVFVATEANQQFTVTFQYNSAPGATFNFDWQLVCVDGGEGTAVNRGENTVKVEIGSLTAYTFTAAVAGEYVFDIPDGVAMYAYYDYWNNGEKSWRQLYSYYSYELTAGQVFTVYLAADPNSSDAPTEDAEYTLNIKYDYKATTDANGNPYLSPDFSWDFDHNYTPGEYVFTAPAGAQFSVDGGKTWQTTLSMELVNGQIVTINVKNDDGSSELVLVTIQHIKYEFKLAAGSDKNNTVTMVPGKEYAVTLTGAVGVKDDLGYTNNSYILSWTDPNIKVTYNGTNMASGDLFIKQSSRTSDINITIIYSGAETAEIVFTLIDPATESQTPPAFDESMLTGTYVYEDAGEMLYKLTFEAGKLTIVDNFLKADGDQNGEYTWAIENGALVIRKNGETVTDFSLTVNETGDLTLVIGTFDYPLTADNGGSNELVLGENAIDAPAGFAGIDVTFTAPADGTYIFAAAEGEENIYLFYGDTGYDKDTLPLSIELTAGQTITINLSAYDYNADTLNIVITTEGGEGGDEPTGPVLNLGNNDFTIVMSDGWPTNVFATFTAPAAGTYVLKPATGELYADVYDSNGKWIEDLDRGYEFTLEAGQSITFEISSTNYMGTQDVVSLVVIDKASEPAGPVLNVGNNSFTITIADGWPTAVFATFTAPKDGLYVVKAAEGEIYADVYDPNGNWIEDIVAGYEFYLNAGESVTFEISTMNYMATEDVVDLVVEVKDGGGDAPSGPVLNLGNNDFTIVMSDGWPTNVFATFTAPAAGTYVLKPATGEVYADVYDSNGKWIEDLDRGYEFTLEAGQSITFEISSTNYMGTQDVVSLVVIDKASEPAGPVLNVGNNSFTITIADGWSTAVFATFTAPEDGLYVVKAAEGEIYADVYDPNGNWIEDIVAGYEFSLSAGESVTFEISTMNYMATEDVVDLVVERIGDKVESGADEVDRVLKLGENTITITEGYMGGHFYTFTAEVAGTYTITDLATNLMVAAYVEKWDMYDSVVLPYSFTLEAGQTVTLRIGRDDWGNGVVTLNLALETASPLSQTEL